MATTATQLTKRGIIELARRDHAKYPQYDGYWDGPEWRLISLKRRIRTKLGVAFEPNDLTIARKERLDGRVSVMAYSVRNKINTAVGASSVTWWEPEPEFIWTFPHGHKCPRCGHPRDCDSTDCSSRECAACTADAERRAQEPCTSSALGCRLDGDCLGGKSADAHVHEIAGQSGHYLVVYNAQGEIVRDDRPWQMRV